MSKLKIMGKEGQAVAEVEVTAATAGMRARPQLLRDVIVGYGRNRRRGTASTLTKGEVRGSGRKPWRQKGTGRARAGYRTSPVWRGGGVVFGPKPRDFSRRIPVGERRKALAAAFADKVRSGEVVVVDSIAGLGAKTGPVARWLKAIHAGTAPLIVMEKRDEELSRAVRNIPGVALAVRKDLNAWHLMAHRKVVLSKDDFGALQEQLA
jgi:large subunit ribosomal protein L4